MKTLKLFFLTLIFCGSNQLIAQDSLSAYKGIINFNPVDFIFGNVGIGYEDFISGKNSLEYGLAFYYYEIISLDKDEIYNKIIMPVSGIGAKVSFRHYFTKPNKVNQIYVGPQIMLKYTEGKRIRVEHAYLERRILQINNYGATLMLQGGLQKQFAIFNKIYFDFHGGFGFKFNTYRYNELRVQEYINHPNLGWAYKDVASRGKYKTDGHGPIRPTVSLGVKIGFPIKQKH